MDPPRAPGNLTRNGTRQNAPIPVEPVPLVVSPEAANTIPGGSYADGTRPVDRQGAIRGAVAFGPPVNAGFGSLLKRSAGTHGAALDGPGSLHCHRRRFHSCQEAAAAGVAGSD